MKIQARSQARLKKGLPIGPATPLFSMKMGGISLLFFFVLISAIGVIYCKHLDRRLHIDLQGLQQTRDELHVEWSRLLLEQGTLASDVRVEQVAREQLGMIVPKPEEMVVMKP